MTYQIYIRPLTIEDAAIAYKWRNNSEVWRFTKANRAQKVTLEIETDWLRKILAKEDERRFAICLKRNDQYIGNIQLLNIKNGIAELHMFIGESEFWGKGIGKEASALILKYAFGDLLLDKVNLDVNKENLPAIAIYKKMGFLETGEKNGFIDMFLTREMFHYQPNKVIYKRISCLEITEGNGFMGAFLHRNMPSHRLNFKTYCKDSIN